MRSFRVGVTPQIPRGVRCQTRCRWCGGRWRGAGSSRAVQRTDARVVRGRVRGADPRAGRAPGTRSAPAATPWWSRRPAPARPCRRSCGRSTGCSPTPPPEDRKRRVPGPLRLPAQGAGRRRRAQPAGAADRDPPHRRPARRAGPDRDRRRALGRHLGRRPAPAGDDAARHHDHHARVAVPDADLAGPRVAARGRDRDPRRGPRGRRHQARRPPGPVAGAARRAAGPARPADRAVRDGAPARRGGPLPRRQAPVEVVAPPSEKRWDLKVVVPVEDMSDLGQPIDDDLEGPASTGPRRVSIWPHVEERVVDLVEQHRSTIVFANSRRLAERLTARFNEIAAERAGLDPDQPSATDVQPGRGSPAQIMAQSGQSDGAAPLIARAHHGSVSKEQRALIEDDLKRGRLPCVVATSSLELGIDMGAVDLVIQIESPPSVASALQRVGRAGHQVGEVSRGVLFPKHRGDLAQTAVAVERMRTGAIESLSVPANPLDVLAQQVVAATALDAWDVETLYALVRRSASFANAAAVGVRRDARPAQRPLPLRRVRRAAAADRVGPGHRPAHRPAGRPAAGGDQRRHDPRPRAVRRLPGRRRRPGQAGRRARRGDGLRVAGRRRVRARRDQLADRGHHPRPGAGHPGARRARPAAVLEGRHPRPPRRARRGGRCLHPGARRADAGGRDRPGPRERPRRVGGRQPGRLPHRAARGDQRRAQRPHPGGRALPRRARRLAAGGALPLRHTGARAVGAGDQHPAARAVRRRRVQRGGLRRRDRRCASPTPTRTRPVARWWSSRRTRSTTWSPARSAGRRCSRAGSASARPGRCCCPAATPADAPRCGSSASGRPSCSRWPRSTRPSRSCSRRSARCCRTSTTCPRWSG